KQSLQRILGLHNLPERRELPHARDVSPFLQRVENILADRECAFELLRGEEAVHYMHLRVKGDLPVVEGVSRLELVVDSLCVAAKRVTQILRQFGKVLDNSAQSPNIQLPQ